MTANSRTSEFRDFVKEKEKEIPEVKRRKLSRPIKRASDEEKDIQATLNREYITEGYNILNHINTLSRMLASVRKPYLNVDSRNPPLLRQGSRNIDLSGPDQQSWANIKHLTNEERDQIDLQARVIFSRCSDRIKEMEALERRRAELVASRVNPLTRFLPARLRQDETTATSDFVAAHHASVNWFLSRRLTEASQLLKEMQEERMKRQLERTKTLGSGAAREAMFMTDPIPSSSSSSEASAPTGSWLGGASSLASSFAATIGTPSLGEVSSLRSTPRTGSFNLSDENPDDMEEDEELELSQSQIMQFEMENANILRDMQDTLASVQQAESRLLEISALQAELVTHLTKQTEQTEQLYEDAIATAETVEKGNAQLKEARRRARDGRKWILLFLIGASLSLLFLHYY
ncbi:uncharacterized protein PHACADRAFT_157701 [Phanerochaete carnosa HHB-10118-sp]|uniref:SNARE-complex protein Syntaxin-18 N-terminal domain-containing protein n=1 Tax=Phanerochaete carnosa (strain HHB-10118-sp) TaxID=650164 RepID=K5WJR4_PHACS|nr:uncharacterized protein PHACADRAFT_157701 [Phanerochaete carnosa HHB-10118-sp]EKM59349.1 hypothetical protein PHACADRAFT_157701 [Phanerochaete carnosa HHB-10118-sp]